MKTEYNPLEQVNQHHLHPTVILGEIIDMNNLPTEENDVLLDETVILDREAEVKAFMNTGPILNNENDQDQDVANDDSTAVIGNS